MFGAFDSPGARRSLLGETPEARRDRKLADITLPELEGWIAEARRDGDETRYRAGLRRKFEIEKGRR